VKRELPLLVELLGECAAQGLYDRLGLKEL
jgi:hypothetical protein